MVIILSKNSIFHSDIKPDNILLKTKELSLNLQPILIDMGSSSFDF